MVIMENYTTNYQKISKYKNNLYLLILILVYLIILLIDLAIFADSLMSFTVFIVFTNPLMLIECHGACVFFAYIYILAINTGAASIKSVYFRNYFFF